MEQQFKTKEELDVKEEPIDVTEEPLNVKEQLDVIKKQINENGEQYKVFGSNVIVSSHDIHCNQVHEQQSSNTWIQVGIV